MYKEDLDLAFLCLKKGGLILYPTDTIWGIGCDATNFGAVEKVYRLKQRSEKKSLVCLVSDTKMLKQYIRKIPSTLHSVIRYANKPTTIIYDEPYQVAENIISNDNSLGIRIVESGFCYDLINLFGKPIVSTSANISGKPYPKNFQEIESQILENVDYVVNSQRKSKCLNPSDIIKIGNDDTIKIIRR